MPNGRHSGKGHSWKDKRNYWKIHTPDGAVKYVIEVDGVRVDVSEDVYLAYSQMDRHSRYTEDEKGVNRKLSLEQMAEDEVLPGYAGLETVPDVAEMFLDADRIKTRQEQINRIREALSSLSDADQKLLHALFVQNISVRQYARTLGVSETAIRKRRDRAIKICKKIVNKEEK